jgi:hypothetical protein
MKWIKQATVWILMAALIGGCSMVGFGTDVKDVDEVKDIKDVKETVEVFKIGSGTEIEVDGLNKENTWKDAKETTIDLTTKEGAEAKSIKIKAICTDDMVYILSKYQDTTPLKIGEAWAFDGTTWKKGSYDDTLGLLFNIDGSIPAFDEDGFGMMDKPMTKEMNIYDFSYILTNNEQANKEKLDFWGWCGLPEFYGRGDDMIMKLDPASQMDTTKPAVLTVQHDAHPNDKPWIRNSITVDGKEVPRYKYKAGKDIDNTPRPYMEDVEEITDYSSFKPGDRAPYVVGIKGAVWGGSKDDILAKGTHEGDTWTVEMGRKLDTGNDDDIQLKAGNSYTFVIIIRDDSKGYAISTPIKLSL